MKKVSNIVIALTILSLFALMISCSEGILPTENTNIPNTGKSLYRTVADCSVPVTVDLFAGQTIPVGVISVYNDATDLHVTYTVDAPWVLIGTHLSVATVLAEIPQNKNANPKVGKFEYGEGELASLTTVTYDIPLPEGYGCEDGEDLFIAAHAKVQMPIEGAIEEPFFLTESAWGNGTQFNESKNWAMYFGYDICCE